MQSLLSYTDQITGVGIQLLSLGPTDHLSHRLAQAPLGSLSERLLAFSLQVPNEEIVMNRDDTEDTTLYKVLVNHEEQYSLWPANRENPLGWRDVGMSGSKAECLAYIKEVWTDMRPLSLRKKMEESGR
jgi:MbtH protein